MENAVGKPNWRSVGSGLGRRLWPLTSDSLRAEAQRRTGSTDVGSPPLEPAFSTLLTSLETEADLHPLGRFLMRIHLRDLLETRLRLWDAWRTAGPSLNASPLQQPLFIVGMPRSGSTFLHELLAEDPAHRAPRVWEVMFPVREKDGGEAERRRKIRKAAACLWWFRRLAPKADSVYPMRASTPHECVAIHSYTFLSEEFVSTCRIPTYERFLRSTDLTPAYLWQRQFLQALQMGCEPRRWVLKSPDHVHGLKQLFAVFPDAVIIQTHRNPLHVLRSSAELTRVLQGLYAWPGSQHELAAREARVLAEGTESFIRFRDEHPELADRFIDIKYSDLVSDPLAAVSQIYQRLGLPLKSDAAERMGRLASTRSRYHKAGNRPEPTDLKVEAPTEADRLQRYCSRFGLA